MRWKPWSNSPKHDGRSPVACRVEVQPRVGLASVVRFIDGDCCATDEESDIQLSGRPGKIRPERFDAVTGLRRYCVLMVEAMLQTVATGAGAAPVCAES